MVTSTEIAGSIIRRVREDKGMSRNELSAKTGVAPRTLYNLETGKSDNFGLGNYLKVLDALGLSMDVTFRDTGAETKLWPSAAEENQPEPKWKLGNIWVLKDGEK